VCVIDAMNEGGGTNSQQAEWRVGHVDIGDYSLALAMRSYMTFPGLVHKWNNILSIYRMSPLTYW
jgi:hypothetical protein